MLDFYIIRHAPVIGQKGVIYGDQVDIDLETTRERIGALAALLPNPDVADWYYSGVDRAYRSALAVLEQQGYGDHKPSAHEGFREQGFGALIGKKHSDITEYLNFVDGKIFCPAPPSGEAIPDLINRVHEAILDVKRETEKNKKKSVVVFSHGGTIRAAHAGLNNLPLENFIDLDTPPLHHYHASLELNSALRESA